MSSETTFPNYYWDWINEDWAMMAANPDLFDLFGQAFYRYVEVVNTAEDEPCF
jgi:hypothetical protein